MMHQHLCLTARTELEDSNLLMTEKLDEKAAAFYIEDPNLKFALPLAGWCQERYRPVRRAQ